VNEKFIDLCFDSDIGTDLVLCIVMQHVVYFSSDSCFGFLLSETDGYCVHM